MKRIVRLKQKRKIEITFAFAFVFILILIYLWDFSVNIKNLEKARGAQTLSDMAVQGATIAENEIKKTATLLWSEARHLYTADDLKCEEILYGLKQTVEDENIDVIRIGITDTKGIAMATDGLERDVSERNFFKEAMKGKVYISKNVKQIMEQQSLVMAVPVFDVKDEVKGVLYGIISTEKFDIYKGTKWDADKSAQYIHIIDSQGNYIVRSKSKNQLVVADNIYEGIKRTKSSVPAEEIKETVRNKEAILTKLEKNGNVRYVYFAPMNVNNWCIVTVLTGEMLEQQIIYSREPTMQLIMKILVTLVILGIACYLVIMKEKQEAEALDRELSMKDKEFRMAIADIGNFVFTYDMAAEKLEFMNYDKEKIWLPEVIENFPDTLTKYFDAKSENYRIICAMIDRIESGAKETESEITVYYGRNRRIYHIKLNSISDANNKTVRLIGTLDDITEERETEIKLRKIEQLRSAVLADTIDSYEVNLTRNCLMRDGALVQPSYSFSQMLRGVAGMKVKDEYREKVMEVFSTENLMNMYHMGMHDVSMEYPRIDENGGELWVRCEVHLEKDIVTEDIIGVTVIRNIHDKKLTELEMENQAILDPLTKAYNRGVSIKKINEILNNNYDMTHAFLLIDLDNFKMVNDTLGHLTGDSVLINVVNILKKHVHEDDIVCRLGGDEFVVFMVDMPRDVIEKNVTKLLSKLKFEYEKDGITLTVSASIGIAVAPDNGSDFQTLYEKADVVLYEVKKESKNNFKFYKDK